MCFQLKSAKRIIACKFFSNILYVLQYVLLGAWIGAAMDAAGTLTAGLGYYRDKPRMQRHRILLLILTSVGITVIGILLYEAPYSLLALAGVLLESAAIWMKREKGIRIVSLMAVPCWLSYNVICGAYGSVIGNVLGAVSIVTALIRHRRTGDKPTA